MTATLPNLSQSFELMKITDDLLEKTDQNTLRGMGIVSLLNINPNKKQVLSIIKAEIEKYPQQMEAIIGKELVERVKNFE